MKNFEINAIAYAVENCTAICAADCGDESKRQDALLVSSERDGEKFQDVVFGYDMPETVEAFLDMCDDYAAWETDAAVIASVRITEVRPYPGRGDTERGWGKC